MQNLEFALPKTDHSELIGHLLETAGLTQLVHRKPHQLSGGQQQRVALVRALVREPELLLMDEPFAALDPEMRLQLQDLLLKLHRERPFTIILVTHDIGEIFRLADRVAIMEAGKLVRTGAPSEVYLDDDRDGLTILGEVLTIENLDAVLLVNAWIDGKIRSVRIPAHWEGQMRPGTIFTLHYRGSNTEIRILKT